MRDLIELWDTRDVNWLTGHDERIEALRCIRSPFEAQIAGMAVCLCELSCDTRDNCRAMTGLTNLSEWPRDTNIQASKFSASPSGVNGRSDGVNEWSSRNDGRTDNWNRGNWEQLNGRDPNVSVCSFDSHNEGTGKANRYFVAIATIRDLSAGPTEIDAIETGKFMLNARRGATKNLKPMFPHAENITAMSNRWEQRTGNALIWAGQGWESRVHRDIQIAQAVLKAWALESEMADVKVNERGKTRQNANDVLKQWTLKKYGENLHHHPNEELSSAAVSTHGCNCKENYVQVQQ